jgi:hypothetical protein
VAPLALATVVVVLATLVAVMAVKRGLRFPRPRWLPAAAAALPPVVLAGAVVRVMIAAPHITADDYAWHSLEWISWWMGKPIIAAATVGAALLAYRVLSDRQPEWMLPLMIFGWTIAVFLLRPAITPPAVPVARHFEVEQGGAMLRTVEGVRGGLIYRHRHGLGRRVRVEAAVNCDRFSLHCCIFRGESTDSVTRTPWAVVVRFAIPKTPSQ